MYLEKQLLKEVSLFAKAQVSAFLGGLIDFGIMVILTQVLGLFYVYSILISGIIGAFANFSINKYWTFEQSDLGSHNQLIKFSLVVMGSILLKSLGTFLLTNVLSIDYKISRIITDAFVCFGFNYLLQRFWVFRK